MENAKPGTTAIDIAARIITAAVLFAAVILVLGFDVHLTEEPVGDMVSLVAYLAWLAQNTTLVALALILAPCFVYGLVRLAVVLTRLVLRKGKPEAGS